MGQALLCAGAGSLALGCTLSFDLPKAVDAGPEIDSGTPDAAIAEACSGAYAPISTNILGATGFEVDLAGWSNATLMLQDTAESLLGVASASIVQDLALRTSFREFPVEASTFYTASVWIKTEGVTDNGCRMRMLWKLANGTIDDSNSTEYLSGTSDWTFIQDTGRSNSDTASVRVQLECTAGTGTGWFDNVWFVQGNGPICGNLNCELEENCLADCERGGAQKLLFAEGFDSEPISDEWNTAVGGAWSVDTSSAQQADTNAASRSHLISDLGPTNYSVAAEMSRTSQRVDGSMGLSLRGGDGEEGYQCNWQPATGTLEIKGADTLASVVLSEIISAPTYSADASFVMQAEVEGNQVSCCLQGIPGASLTVSDSSIVTGTPGMRTSGLSANFDSFTVVAK